MKKQVSVTVNGERRVADVPIRSLLVDLIRDELGLTATHIGCTYEGRCGACTVLLDGDAVKSCLVLAVQVDGREVVTSEGLREMGRYSSELHPVPQAFWERHGLQCGYCTSGMMMAAVDLLKSELAREQPDLTDEGIRRGLVGNICRCTGYSHIVEAVQAAAERLQDMPVEERDACLGADSAREDLS